jgi:hypothetical protein
VVAALLESGPQTGDGRFGGRATADRSHGTAERGGGAPAAIPLPAPLRGARARPESRARDIPAVLDARIRRRRGNLTPHPPNPWSAQIPDTDNPERGRFLNQLATAMDDRRRRIGEHTAATSRPWAVAARDLSAAWWDDRRVTSPMGNSQRVANGTG